MLFVSKVVKRSQKSAIYQSHIIWNSHQADFKLTLAFWKYLTPKKHPNQTLFNKLRPWAKQVHLGQPPDDKRLLNNVWFGCFFRNMSIFQVSLSEKLSKNGNIPKKNTQKSNCSMTFCHQGVVLCTPVWPMVLVCFTGSGLGVFLGICPFFK